MLSRAMEIHNIEGVEEEICYPQGDEPQGTNLSTTTSLKLALRVSQGMKNMKLN